MKKQIGLILALLFSISLVSCASPSGGISQEEYDTLKSQYDALQTDYDSLEAELDAANKQIEKLLDETKKAEEQTPATAAVDVVVHEDDYVSISFIGCELDDDDQELVFMVTNKTGSELTFQSGSMAIDGLSLGHVSGSDSVAAQSKGKVRFETDEEFPSMTPSTISGTISVIDFGKTLWDKMSYDVTFSNLSVAP